MEKDHYTGQAANHRKANSNFFEAVTKGGNRCHKLNY